MYSRYLIFYVTISFSRLFWPAVQCTGVNNVTLVDKSRILWSENSARGPFSNEGGSVMSFSGPSEETLLLRSGGQNNEGLLMRRMSGWEEDSGWESKEGAEGWQVDPQVDSHEDKSDGVAVFNSLVAIKYLKLGKYLILGILMLLVLALGLAATLGVTLSPVSLPFLALPIAIAALFLFFPVFIVAFFLVAFQSTFSGRRRRPHGWSRRSSLSHPNSSVHEVQGTSLLALESLVHMYT